MHGPDVLPRDRSCWRLRAQSLPHRLRGPSPSTCFWFWRPTSRAASTARNFSSSAKGMPRHWSNPRVLDAIQSGRRGRIGVMFLEWSGLGNQKVVIDWMVVDGPKAAQAFGDRLLESPRSFADRTSISGGIDAAVAQLARAPFEASAAPSMSRVMGPTMPAATSDRRVMRPWLWVSASTDW